MPVWINWIDEPSPVAVTIISIALMLAIGFLMTRITKLLKLPNVTAYIVGGILAGPFCLNLLPDTIVEGTSFLPDIALAFIAFSTGEFFRLSTLKRNGGKVLMITVLESCCAAVLWLKRLKPAGNRLRNSPLPRIRVSLSPWASIHWECMFRIPSDTADREKTD